MASQLLPAAAVSASGPAGGGNGRAARTMKRCLASIAFVLAVGMPYAGHGMPDDVPAGTGSRAAPPQHISAVQAAVLGVVEGLTEYLPVSSTGHLILTSYLMGITDVQPGKGVFGGKVAKTPALDVFEIVIQLGAILAVLGLYRKIVGRMFLGLAGRDAGGLRLVGLLIVAFLPAAVVGLAFGGAIKEHLFAPGPVAFALIVGGVAMIAGEEVYRRRRLRPDRVHDLSNVRFSQAAIVGFAQCLALWPGTSRSMVTIVAGLLVGLDMIRSAEFSFLLALPTLGSATLYEGARHWHELVCAAGWSGLAIGLLASAVVAALAVRGFVGWLQKRPLWPFGVYRVVAGAAALAVLAFR